MQLGVICVYIAPLVFCNFLISCSNGLVFNAINMNLKKLKGFPGSGTLAAVLFLIVFEAAFHVDDIVYKYRSVFASARAMDKMLYIESNPPALIVAGNSRIDNAINPRVLIDSGVTHSSFNLGVPGANARVLYGMFKRMDDKGLLGTGAVERVVLGLDESLFQSDDSLGYAVFFADRNTLFENGEYRDLWASILRSWGYSGNIKQLKEPAKLIKFVEASFQDVDAWGGSAKDNLGFRAASSGEFQAEGQVMLQQAGSLAPPVELVSQYLWELLDLLQARGVEVGVVFPPILNREVLFVVAESAVSAPYREILHRLNHSNVQIFNLATGYDRVPAEFANAGHLNEQGAYRYSNILAQKMRQVWE